MNRWFRLAILILLACSCSGERKHKEGILPHSPSGSGKYARGFSIRDYGDYTMLEVRDPWQNSKGVTFTYLLAEDRMSVPDSLAHHPFIKIPVQRVIALSTTHLAMISQLGMEKRIMGFSGNDLVYSMEVAERIRKGEVLEVGYDQGLNYEAIVKSDPDVMFIYGVEGPMQGSVTKLEELKVPVVYCGEYLEPHPLGKAEWIRFIGQFFQLETEADHFFGKLDSAYRSLVSLAGEVEEKPEVLMGLPWNDTWFVAGGNSYAARLIRDAGGDYLWKDNPSDEAVPLDLESVYVEAMHADIWINPGAASSLNELYRFDPRFKDLPVLINGSVFNNNRRVTESGGNDYWESGTVRPDLVLADLIKIFHPDLLTGHRFIYYRKLK